MNDGWMRRVMPAATAVAILVAAVLLAGVLSVPLRNVFPPEGYDQPRLHGNTKNTTRIDGVDLERIALRVSGTVYPATVPENTPDTVILYPPDAWRSALAASSLVRPLNALLLPATDGVREELRRLRPGGTAALDGAQLIILDDAYADATGFRVRRMTADEAVGLRLRIGEPPRHALLVDPNDPETAVLAAPWAAFSSDVVVFDVGQIPDAMPVFAIGGAAADRAESIGGRTPEHTAAAFASYESEEYPFFGWGMNAESRQGYRAFTLARKDRPEIAVLSANLARRGKPGPLLWSEERELPQVVNNYLWGQRAAFWETPSEGPFHHVFVLGGTSLVSYPAQAQADYALEIGPYMGKGAGMSGIDMVGAAWIMFGIAAAFWILLHEARYLAGQNAIMRYAWPLMALLLGPFAIPFYYLAYHRPVIRHGGMEMWDRPVWIQSLTATVSAVGYGATIMIATGFILSWFGLPLIPLRGTLFFLGAPMILEMIANYLVAVLVSWLLFQTPMLAMFYGRSYRATLFKALPLVLISMTAAALAMNPGMWWLMMWRLPMMPSEESILWFGVMFFTGFLAFLLAWPFNHVLVRRALKSGMM